MSTATLYPPGLYTPGSLDGATEVSMNSSNGYAYHNMSFNQVGRYILAFQVVSDPGDYNLSVQSVAIDVEDARVAQIFAESISLVTLTLDYDYATYVSGDEDYFMVAIANTLRGTYGNVSFGDFSVTAGRKFWSFTGSYIKLPICMTHCIRFKAALFCINGYNSKLVIM